MPQGLRRDSTPPPRRVAEWLLLLVRLPGETAKPAGILLLDVPSDKIYVALADEIGGDEGTNQVWAELKEGLEQRALEVGGASLLNALETDLSHFLQISGGRRQISTTDPAEAVGNLFREYILKHGHLAQDT